MTALKRRYWRAFWELGHTDPRQLDEWNADEIIEAAELVELRDKEAREANRK